MNDSPPRQPADDSGITRPPGNVHALNELPLEQLREFIKGYRGDWRGSTPRARGVAPPPVQKPCDPNLVRVDLVEPQRLTLGNMPVAEAIRRRRSRAQFTGECLSNEELSYLLWSTQGVSRIEHDAEGRIDYHLRTSPSGGARHPFETYLILNRVENMEPGAYRFLPFEHKLVALGRPVGLAQRTADACYQQDFVAAASVVFVWAAVPSRTEWGYGYVAHRMIAVEAGHVCQNLYLAGESIGAGVCAVLGYDQDAMDELIGVDGREEFVVYLAAVGKTARE